jgi:hypothetical protein
MGGFVQGWIAEITASLAGVNAGHMGVHVTDSIAIRSCPNRARIFKSNATRAAVMSGWVQSNATDAACFFRSSMLTSILDMIYVLFTVDANIKVTIF